MSHLSYEGQSKVDYCLECAVKHGQTAKVLMREALQRAEASGSESEGVVEKVRGVVEELSGLEDDTNTIENESVTALNNLARDIRKDVFASKCEIGGCNIESLRQIKERIDGLVDLVYLTRQKEECPTCKIKAEIEEPKVEKPSLEEYGKSVSEKRRQFMEEIRSKIGS
jgi:hypothetical protein